jgi:hypothetical protein
VKGSNYFIYKMGCSSSTKAEDPVAIIKKHPHPPLQKEFDDYAAEKYDFSLEA